MSRIERIYGPFNHEEIEFYKQELTKDDRPDGCWQHIFDNSSPKRMDFAYGKDFCPKGVAIDI